MAKLLFETNNNVEVLVENTSTGKQLYIEGIFAQAEVRNGNKRFYSKSIMEKALNSYVDTYVSTRRALGELNHPDRPFVDPAEAAILIESLTWQGNDIVGKARVLNTPRGQVVAGLLEGGFNMGVSTRGLGSLRESGGIKYVQDDYMMTAIDAVDGPSGPNCYVRPMVESSWINKNGVWIPVIDECESQEFNQQLFLERLDTFVKSLKR